MVQTTQQTEDDAVVAHVRFSEILQQGTVGEKKVEYPLRGTSR